MFAFLVLKPINIANVQTFPKFISLPKILELVSYSCMWVESLTMLIIAILIFNSCVSKTIVYVGQCCTQWLKKSKYS